MANRRKLREEDISQLQDDSEIKCQQTDRSTLPSNDTSEIHHLSQISYSTNAEENILNEFSQTHTSVSEQCISKDEKERGFLI